MRFRKIRKIRRWGNLRTMTVVSACFVAGMFFGWKQPLGSSSSLVGGVDDAPSDVRTGDFDDDKNMEVLGRKKLSVRTEKLTGTFTRLPPSFEKNIFPPRAPSKTFHLEPHTVIERNRVNGKGRSHYFMLFIVKSSPVHTTRREIIRKTWGAVKVADGLLFNTIFVVGKSGDGTPLDDILQKENAINGDILQTDTPEGYRNLPFKVLSAMQWLISKSSDISSDFYTFTDDDCVMNIANIVDFFGVLPFIDEEREPPLPFRPNDTRAHPSVKEIQTIEPYKKKKVNEVTLSPTETIPSEENVVKDDFPDHKQPALVLDQKSPKSSEPDSDLVENLEIYAEMDPNAKIQIERTGNDDERGIPDDSEFERLPAIEKFDTSTSTFNLDDFNPAYKHNSANLTNYLKTALGRTDSPGAIFRSRFLQPDGIYCGFSYDPRGKPHRRLKDKWGVTMEQYSENIYPSFCHGGMYTMSGALMTSIFSVSTVTDWKLFHLEDVLVTGILREKTGVQDSKFIRRGTDPKIKPLMYYVWDSGPRVMLKMSRKWKFFTRQLLAKRFVMEAMRNGKVISWTNYGRSV